MIKPKLAEEEDLDWEIAIFNLKEVLDESGDHLATKDLAEATLVNLHEFHCAVSCSRP